MNKYTKHLLKQMNNDIHQTSLISPFPRTTQNAYEYEDHKSFSYDWETGKFHDFTRTENSGYSETQLCQKVEEINQADAEKLVNVFNNSNYKIEPKEIIFKDISKQIFENLGVSQINGATFSLPIKMYGKTLDIRNYYQNGNPKIVSQKGSIVGLICPFDKWVKTETNGLTLICEGEKDMLIARSKGFRNANPAICITGGALSLPKYQKRFIKNRRYFIIFDNDIAGENGMLALANYLLDNGAKSVKMTNNICADNVKSSDLYDFFSKYGKTKKDLIDMYHHLDFVEPLLSTKAKLGQTVLLKDIIRNPWLTDRSCIYSKIHIISKAVSQNYYLPTSLGFNIVNENGIEVPCREKVNVPISDFLYYIRNETTLINWIKKRYLVKKEAIVKFQKEQLITSYFITNEGDYSQPYLAYKIGHQLNVSKKYKAKLKIVRDPNEKRKIAFLITDAKETESLFKYININDITKKVLDSFKKTTKDIDSMYKSFLSYLGSYVDKHIYILMELVFHSQLEFFYQKKVVSGVIDSFLIGDTRVGKSDTYQVLSKLYKQGNFINLKTITETALLGGVYQTNGPNQISIGELSKNHEGIVALEELQGASFDVHKALTDIKSREIVKIDRVGLSMETPTKIRLITMANPKNASVTFYSNGSKIVRDLCARPEDLARYDLVTIIGALDRNIKPYEKQNKTDEEVDNYRLKMKWSMSRTKNNIIIDSSVEDYIWKKTTELNKIFDGSLQYLGREGYQKIAKIAVALASWLVSTDTSYKNIIVLKEHVDWVYDFIYENYARKEFKLDDIVKKERETLIMTEEDINYVKELLSGSWKEHIIDLIDNSGRYSKKEFKEYVNTADGAFNEEFKKLLKHKLIQYNKDRIWVSKKLHEWYEKNNE